MSRQDRNCSEGRKKQMKFLQIALPVVMGLALAGGSAAAQEERAPEALVISATIHPSEQARPQTIDALDRDPDRVELGDMVEYRLVFTNITERPVNNIQFTDPLPEGMHYLQGTAGADREDVDVEFSLDGGTSYSEQPMVEVVSTAESSCVPLVRRITRTSGGQCTARFSRTPRWRQLFRSGSAGWRKAPPGAEETDSGRQERRRRLPFNPLRNPPRRS